MIINLFYFIYIFFNCNSAHGLERIIKKMRINLCLQRFQSRFFLKYLTFIFRLDQLFYPVMHLLIALVKHSYLIFSG